MPVVEYKLIKNNRGVTTPAYISDGGQWFNPSDKTMVGWVPAEADRNYWVPDTLVELSREDFVARALAIHAVQPMVDFGDDPSAEMNALSDAEVETKAGEWFDNYPAK